ncbi:CYFA0S14e02432g1_1 [Cyberlindnera fabianii]|uniref:CYFA0S14e02432g1_1 n=1 Tax=Cyberlindnera fabianii TaxID=36022 RepID=A0A061B4F9_CYBFA|nr:Polyamine transporter 4 [Cyberlindnera fabianii]CDR44381.1 CYFA0S14e02432g1_1 [Cyberlindnera fabianii]
MGVFGASKAEEEALRAQTQAETQLGSLPSSTSLDRTSTTDYESAYSQVPTDDEGEDDSGNAVTAATGATGTGRTTSDNESVETLKRDADTTLGSNQKTPEPEIDAAQVEDYRPETTPAETDDDVAPGEPIQITRTLSHARSRTSFQDVYGEDVTSEDPTKQAEDYPLALQRTISRKSLHSHRGQTVPENDQDGESTEGVNPSTLDWDSPTDKGNPKNWPNWKRWSATMVTACICLVVTFGSSLYVCGVPDIVIEMGVSQELAISGLTFYLLGLAFGPAVAAPISELFGRRLVYITSLPICMLFTMGVGLSSKIRDILVLRFFAGFFASPAMAVAGGTISDIWEFEMMGLAMAGFCLAPFLGPTLGPVIGGFVAENKGWKWTMWVNLMVAGVILVPVLLTPETYKPAILRARAKKRGIKLAKSGSLGDFLKVVFTVTLMTPIKMLFVEPIVMVFSIYIAFVFAVLFGFFEAYPIIFRGVYKMELGISGLTFIGIMIGFIIGTAFYVYFDRFVWFKKNPDGTRGARDEQGNLKLDKPESRLFLAKVGAIALPPSLFWLGWSSKESVHWICPVIAGVPFGFGLIMIFFCTMIYFTMSYPALSLASALAANNLLRYILASVFPLFTVQMYDRLGIDWASSLFAFIAVGLMPVPWIFEKWGPKLRMKSQFGYAAMMKNQAAQEKSEKEVVSGSSLEEKV